MAFILAQICGAIALVLTVVSVQFKEKEKIMICMVLANIVVATEYFLLDALTGAVISILNAIRCLVFYYYKKKNMKPSLFILIVFELIAIISGRISWQNMWSLIPIVVTVIYTYGLWQDNVKVIRITTGIVGLGWATYNVVVEAFIGAIQEASQLISAIIAIYRSKNKKNENEI